MRRPENRSRRLPMAGADAGADHRWPNVDRLLNRQPWKEVERIVRRENVPDPEGTAARLQRFVEMLLQWNMAVSNLISKNDEARIVAAHVLPAIEVAGWLRSQELGNWCDLGSGGGFPAIPLAICGVGEAWDLIESRRTKTLFMRRAVEDLRLSGVRVIAARIEDLLFDSDAGARAARSAEASRATAETGSGELAATWGDDAGESGPVDAEGVGGWGDELAAEQRSHEPRLSLRSPYDGFTSRATMALGPTLTSAARIVRPGGHAFLWKGSRLEQEASGSPEWRSWWDDGEVRSLSIPHSVVASFIRNSR